MKENKNTGSYSHLKNVVIITALPVFLYKIKKNEIEMLSNCATMCMYLLQKYVKLF